MLNTDNPRGEEGLTLIEMVIVVVLASVVLAAAMGALTSFGSAAASNNSIVGEQQAASTVMAQLERDIRSASAISIPSGASPSDQLQLTLPGGGGSTTQVLWIYDPASGTIARETEVGGAFRPSGYSTGGVGNGTATPVFTYYASDGTDISSTTVSNIAMCSTAVGIHVTLTSSRTGIGPYQETAEVALTDQALALTAPGDGQCGSA